MFLFVISFINNHLAKKTYLHIHRTIKQLYPLAVTMIGQLELLSNDLSQTYRIKIIWPYVLLCYTVQSRWKDIVLFLLWLFYLAYIVKASSQIGLQKAIHIFFVLVAIKWTTNNTTLSEQFQNRKIIETEINSIPLTYTFLA